MLDHISCFLAKPVSVLYSLILPAIVSSSRDSFLVAQCSVVNSGAVECTNIGVGAGLAGPVLARPLFR